MEYILKNKDNIEDLTTHSMCFKKKSWFLQLLNLLKCTNFFCFEYDLMEGCS